MDMNATKRQSAHDRLTALVQQAGGPTRFGKQVGYGKAWISALVNGTKDFGFGAQASMAQRLGHHPGWFWEEADPTGAPSHIPVKKWDLADKPAPPECDFLKTGLSVSTAGYALLMESNAMMSPNMVERSIPVGVYLVIDPSQPYARGDDVVVRMSPGAAPCVRRVLEDGPNKYLKAMNPDYPGLQQITSFVRVLGRVVGIQASY